VGWHRALLGITVAALALSGALLGCGPPRGRGEPAEKEKQETALPPVASEEVQAFRLASHTEDGRERWEISGRGADLLAETMELSDITATTYGKGVDVTLTAKAGTFDRARRDVFLRGDVRAVTTEGTTLTAPSLVWNAERQVVRTEEWTKVERGQLTVQAQGAVGFPQLARVRFLEDVRVDIAPATTITCEGLLEVDYKRHRASFHRKVHMEDARGQIWADRMDVYMDPKTRALKKVQCWGRVRIQQGLRVAQARRAIYQSAPGTLVLIGHPRVTFLGAGGGGGAWME